ncbi:MAG: GGDEF domain-containing protein [Magnetococcales bacterium]|nr:GGDEF domain-containing protein [Magnetococcales bacterium]
MTPFEQELIHSKLFKDLPAPFFLQELSGSPVITVPPGAILLAPGQMNRNVHLVLSGTLSIHLESPETPAVSVVGTGEIVGELSLLAHSVTSAWVIGQTSAQLLVIDEQRLWHLIDLAPIIARNLLAILTGWITSVNTHVIDQRKQIDALQDVARIDALTGLFNRRWFDESLLRLLPDRGVHHPLALILMDVDHFKHYNDTHGHPGGDQALRALAETLKSLVRQGDVAARYGGEEFALILPDTPLPAALAVANRMRAAAMHCVIRASDGQILPPITLSLGVAASRADSTPASLTAEADARLYQAKKEGRNRCCS